MPKNSVELRKVSALVLGATALEGGSTLASR